MAVNRFDQFAQPLTYTPMSLQEMLIGPQYLQQKQDELENQLLQEQLIDQKALDYDKPEVDKWLNNYNSRITAITDDLLEKGYSRDKAREFKKLAMDKFKAQSSNGILGRAGAAYDAYMKNLSEERDRLERGEISSDVFRAGLKRSLDNYERLGGAKEGATYSPFTSNKYIDGFKLAADLAKDITINEIEQSDNYRILPDGVIEDIKTKRKWRKADLIAELTMRKLLSDKQFTEYISQAGQLGVLDPKKSIEDIADTVSRAYAIDNTSTIIDRDFGLLKKSLSDEMDTKQMLERMNPAFYNRSVERVDLQDKLDEYNKDNYKKARYKVVDMYGNDITNDDHPFYQDKFLQPQDAGLATGTSQSIASELNDDYIKSMNYYKEKYPNGFKIVRRTDDEAKAYAGEMENKYRNIINQWKNSSNLSDDQIKSALSTRAKSSSTNELLLEIPSDYMPVYRQDMDALKEGDIGNITLDNTYIYDKGIVKDEEEFKEILGIDDMDDVEKINPILRGLDGRGSIVYDINVTKKNGEKVHNRISVGNSEIGFGARSKVLDQIYNYYNDDENPWPMEFKLNDGIPLPDGSTVTFKAEKRMMPNGNVAMTIQPITSMIKSNGDIQRIHKEKMYYNQFLNKYIKDISAPGLFQLNKSKENLIYGE